MSNILNLKGVKFFAIIVLAVAVLATFGMVAVQSASADCIITTTLRVGSTGTEVQCLQGKVGATADGKFGPMTAVAVKAFQASKNLSADGVVGPMTAAALNGVMSSSGTLPAGCTSTAGYSVTTGTKCDTMVSGSFPAGCSSAAGYSITTGVKCDSTTGGNTSGALEGGAGDITVTELSSPSSSVKVGEGESDVKVLGFEVEADEGSDVKISSVKITLEHTSGSGNEKLDRYAEEVSIWMGSTKVGSVDVDEFSEDSGVYTKTITLSNAIVRADETVKFYVAVDAVNDIDSGNTGSSNNTWTATLTSTRFEDASGAILTDTTASIANTTVFDTLSNTGDVELKVALSSGSPIASTVKVSTTADTNQVKVLEFTLKAQNSAMIVDQIPVTFASTLVESGGVDSITSNVTLKIDGETFNEAVSTAASSVTISFNDLGIELAADETLTAVIYADINDIDAGTFAEGNELTASITSALVVTTGSSAGALDVEDKNGDQLAAGDRSGSAIGNAISFRTEGVNVVMGTPTYVTSTHSTSGDTLTVKYTIPVAVTSFGDTLYMGQAAQFAATATASNSFAVVFENSTAPTTADVTSSASIALSTTNALVESNGYRLDDGVTKNFTIEVTLNTPGYQGGLTAGNYRVRLDELRTFTGAGLESAATATNNDLVPTTSYRTDFKYITS